MNTPRSHLLGLPINEFADDVDGFHPAFSDPIQAMPFAKNFMSAEFSDLAIKKLPYLEHHRGKRVSIESYKLAFNPHIGKTGKHEILFRAKTFGSSGEIVEGYYFARAFTKISTRPEVMLAPQ